MKLYELTEEFKRLEEMAETIESEEDAQAFSDLWSEIAGNFEEKAERTAIVIRNLDLQAELLKKEEARLALRRKTMEGSSDRLREYLETHMKISGIDKIKGNLFTLSIQKNPASLKVNEDLLPNDWKVVSYKPDNARIKESLKAGNDIPGAWLEQSETIRIK